MRESVCVSFFGVSVYVCACLYLYLCLCLRRNVLVCVYGRKFHSIRLRSPRVGMPQATSCTTLCAPAGPRSC